MIRALAIGAVTAMLLTYMRGGSMDSPWVPIIFGLAGFFGSLVLSWLFRRDTLQAIEHSLGRIPRSTHVRDLLALAIAASMFWWSGPFIISAGFGGWLVMIFLSIACPLAVCLLASRWPIAFGLLTVTGISVSVLFENSRWSLNHGNTRFWERFWSGGIEIFLIGWAVSVVLSLIVSVPIQLRRKRASRHVQMPPSGS